MKLLLTILFFSHDIFAFDYDLFAEENIRNRDNTVTVQITRSTYPLDWTTPRGLLKSILKNRYWFPRTKKILGHLTVEVNCTVANNRVRLFTGQAAKDYMQFSSKALDGFGFSILNSPAMKNDYPLVTVEGRLSTYQEMREEFALQIQRDNLSILSFDISQNACINAYLFLRSYKNKTRRTAAAGNHYGFGVDPSRFHGAGSASFVQTVLNRAELYEAADSMNQTIHVAKTLMGSKQRPVSLLELFWATGDLQTPSFRKIPLTFADPEKLYGYLQDNLDAKEAVWVKKLGAKSWYLHLDKVNSVDSAAPL